MAGKQESIREKYYTGKGELTGFISIFNPSTKYGKTVSKGKEGKYSANLLISKEEGEALVEKILELRTKQFKTYGKGSRVVEITQCIPYEILNSETGEAIADKEGRYVIKASNTAIVGNDEVPSFKIPVVDSQCKPVKDARVGAGTIARLFLSLSGYTVAGKTGVSVRLTGVQIIKLVEYAASTTAKLEFEVEEGGYVYEESEEDMAITEEESGELDF